jgi:hypothetical protein
MAERAFIDTELVLLPPEDGGRLSPISSDAYGGKYRPHIVLQPRSVREAVVEIKDGMRCCDEHYIGVAFWEGASPIPIGESFSATLLLMYYPNAIYDECIAGAPFTLREGHKIIGHGEIKQHRVMVE